MDERRRTEASLIEELQAIQDRHGHLPEDELRLLSSRLRVPLYRIEGLASFFPRFRRVPRAGREVRVCVDLPCRLRVPRLFDAAIEAAGAEASVEARSCLGLCEQAAAAVIDGRVLAGLDENSLRGALSGDTWPPPSPATTTGEYRIDPYRDGVAYLALRRVLAESGQAPGAQAETPPALEVLRASGLRGMGGAGFPAAAKWEIVRRAQSQEKFVVCNADESEPGTVKDRFLLDRFPDLVVEGMAVAAVVTGARRATAFIRHDYRAQRAALASAMRRFRMSPYGGTVHLDIFESPGGYICGEETALLEVMEGRRAEPRARPPYPGTHGLWGKPTLVSNVETLAWVPAILLRGADWFAGQGANGAKGLKFIAVSGHVERPGVYEVPLGIRAMDLIERHAGGMAGGRRLKAFSPGGPSSGFLPASAATTPLDFQSLQQAGSMLGAGAMIVLAEGTCMIEAALWALRFFRRESCGKCVPCRVGTEKMVALAERIGRGAAGDEDLAAACDLVAAMELGSICGLGQTAPAAMRSVLAYFPGEVAAHRAGRCPEGARHG